MDETSKQELAGAIRVFAHYLGINVDTELDLMSVAEEAFYDLPEDWEIGIGEEHKGMPYFYNSKTGTSDWNHPKEEMCFSKVKQARRDRESLHTTKSLNRDEGCKLRQWSELGKETFLKKRTTQSLSQYWAAKTVLMTGVSVRQWEMPAFGTTFLLANITPANQSKPSLSLSSSPLNPPLPCPQIPALGWLRRRTPTHRRRRARPGRSCTKRPPYAQARKQQLSST